MRYEKRVINKAIVVTIIVLSVAIGFFILLKDRVLFSPVCTDSDGGINPYVKGETNNGDYYFNDTCYPSETNFLYEYYCGIKDNDILNPFLVFCPNGCSDGACIGEPVTTCQEGWKCMMGDASFFNSSCFYPSNPFSASYTNFCEVGCEFGKCIEDNTDYDLGILEITAGNLLLIEEESTIIEITFKNNKPVNLNNIDLFLDDSKGWKVEKFVNFTAGETKTVQFNISAKNLHTLYNLHYFKIKTSPDLFVPKEANFFRWGTGVFDKDALNKLNLGEEKTIWINDKSYNCNLTRLSNTGGGININGESISFGGTIILFPQKLSDGSYIGIFDWVYQGFSGGEKSATIALSLPGKEAVCEDSDSGIDYYQKGEACFGVACIDDSCINVNTLNETYCDGSQIKTQSYTCDSGKTCSNGRCSSPGSVECNGDDDCMLEATGSPYCDGNQVCIGSISYDCINPGTAQSYCNSTSIKYCTLCSDGCQNNQCINKTSPTPNPEPECEPVGLRKIGKYCSINNVWKNQKEEEIACENNFECKSNNCLDGVCGGKKYPEYVTYLIIAGVVIVIIGIVLVIRKATR